MNDLGDFVFTASHHLTHTCKQANSCLADIIHWCIQFVLTFIFVKSNGRTAISSIRDKNKLLECK